MMPSMSRSSPATASSRGGMSGTPSGGSIMAPMRTASGKERSLSSTLRDDLRVDLLQVQVADSVGILFDQFEAVTAVVGNVSGVEAEVDPLGIGGLQESFDVWLVADMAVGVGVELHVQAVLLKNPSPQFV